jgi:hypothetical protein
MMTLAFGRAEPSRWDASTGMGWSGRDAAAGKGSAGETRLPCSDAAATAAGETVVFRYIGMPEVNNSVPDGRRSMPP